MNDAETKNAGPRKGGSRAAYALLGTAGLLGLGYVGVAVALKDTIPKGMTVGGVRVANLTPDQRTAAVKALAYPHADEAATITVGRHSFPAQVGKAWHPDAEASLMNLTGFTLNPRQLWNRSIGGEGDTREVTFEPNTQQIADIVDAAMQKNVPNAAQIGSVKFIDGEVIYTAGVKGASVDAPTVAQDIAEHFPKTKSFTGKEKTDLSDTAKALKDFADGDAKKAMSQPLKFTANGETVEVPQINVSNSISTEIIDGKPRIKVDSKRMLQYVFTVASDMRVAPTDAKVKWTNGKPSVVPGKDGKKIDEAKMAVIVANALITDHHANVPLTTDQPAVTPQDINVAALPSTSISHFDSKLPTGPENAARTKNITTAINHLNGMVVLPGQQFSLLRALGYDLSKKNGYVEAGTIQDGRHIDGMGGGVSQVSTTLYNAAFLAGVQLDGHMSHTYYFPRYPEGREATLWNPGVDNTWTNDTGHLILIKAKVANDTVSMDFYGTRRYTVETQTGERTNVVPTKTKEVTGVPNCEDTEAGEDGFEIDVFRKLLQGGTVVKTEKIHSKYQPDDAIRCVG